MYFLLVTPRMSYLSPISVQLVGFSCSIKPKMILKLEEAPTNASDISSEAGERSALGYLGATNCCSGILSPLPGRPAFGRNFCSVKPSLPSLWGSRQQTMSGVLVESLAGAEFCSGEVSFPPPGWGRVFFQLDLQTKLQPAAPPTCQGGFDLTQSNVTYNFNSSQEGVI
jgi:hypothetical protein